MSKTRLPPNRMFVLLGQHGAGKSTVGKLLATAYDIPFLSAGDMLREIERDNERKDMLGGYETKSGGYIASDIISNIVTTKLSSLPEYGCVLDGFPRKLDQLDALLSWADKQPNRPTINFVFIDASDSMCKSRISDRGAMRAEDAHDATIASRMGLFHKETVPVIARTMAVSACQSSIPCKFFSVSNNSVPPLWAVRQIIEQDAKANISSLEKFLNGC